MGRLFWLVMALIGGGLILLIANHESGRVFGLPTETFGSALYLGVWGLVIAVFIIASGFNTGAFVRNLAVWTLILLVLVAGYQYRYELQDVANRLTAGLVPASPISAITEEGATLVQLDKQASGHFEVRGEVNGVSVRFLIDTGATSTVLTAQDARRAGIDLESLSFSIPVTTANGVTRAARTAVEEIRIGEIVRSNVPVLVAAPDRLTVSLLGMNVIGTLSGFDVRGDRMILRD
jgi:aspartyl protease family protein